MLCSFTGASAIWLFSCRGNFCSDDCAVFVGQEGVENTSFQDLFSSGVWRLLTLCGGIMDAWHLENEGCCREKSCVDVCESAD